MGGFDDGVEKGVIKDIGLFLDGHWDGYATVEGEGADVLKGNIDCYLRDNVISKGLDAVQYSVSNATQALEAW